MRRMVRSAIALISLFGCAAAPAPAPVRATTPTSSQPATTASARPTLVWHRLVEQGEFGPSRPELRPYIRQVPLVRISQNGESQGSAGSFELVVFADGRAFFEGEHRVAEIGFRTQLLESQERLALIDELEKTCPTLSVGSPCSDSTRVSMSCSLHSGDFVGRDGCAGDARDHLTATAVMRAIRTAGLEKWIAPDPAGRAFYAASEIDKTLRPVPWKKYVPAPAAAVASRVRRKWCPGLKPPAVVGAPRIVDVEPDDARAIVAKMGERTDMPVISISRRSGFVQAVAKCCPTPSPGDCGMLIVQFEKQNEVWIAVGSREIPGE
jgi:hypothetical protein